MALQNVGKRDLTWDIAQLYPAQGNWSVEEYLLLETNRLIEFENGRLNFLPMPSYKHQLLAYYIWTLLRQFFKQSEQTGRVVGAPFPIHLWEGQYREPDVAVMLGKNEWRCEDTFWRGADMVFEVISPSNARHDTETKRREYAEAGIPEYWLIDPKSEQITVLQFEGGRFTEVGTFSRGQHAVSTILPSFKIDLADLFEQAR